MAAVLIAYAQVEAADHSSDPIVSRIPRENVESTALISIGYSKRLRALELEFHDGSIYRYLGVPVGVFLELEAAESRAGYYNGRIRGKYRCLRVRARRSS